MENNQYNLSFLAKEELVARLQDKVNPLELNKIVSAYELAQEVHAPQTRNDESPYFYHSSRVCKILIDELECSDTDLLCASLLHDVLEDSEEVTRSVLEYNFGSYVAYVVDMLTKDLDRQRAQPDETDLAHVEALKGASEDCLLIRLCARLDNFRCLEFNLKRNPIKYVNDTTERYLPLAEHSTDARLQYLVREIKKERGKFLS